MGATAEQLARAAERGLEEVQAQLQASTANERQASAAEVIANQRAKAAEERAVTAEQLARTSERQVLDIQAQLEAATASVQCASIAASAAEQRATASEHEAKQLLAQMEEAASAAQKRTSVFAR